MSTLFNIKNRLNIVVVVEISLSISILFQDISIVVKNEIVLVILPMFALMANQIYAYLHLEREKLILNKLKWLVFFKYSSNGFNDKLYTTKFSILELSREKSILSCFGITRDFFGA